MQCSLAGPASPTHSCPHLYTTAFQGVELYPHLLGHLLPVHSVCVYQSQEYDVQDPRKEVPIAVSSFALW